MIGVLLCTTLYLQIGAGFSALHAGLTIAPWSLGTAIGAVVGSAVLVPRIGRTTLHIGYVVMLVATVATIAVVEHVGTGITTLQLLAPRWSCGIGLGMCIAPMFAFILAGVDEVETGSASGVLNALQQFGVGDRRRGAGHGVLLGAAQARLRVVAEHRAVDRVRRARRLRAADAAAAARGQPGGDR